MSNTATTQNEFFDVLEITTFGSSQDIKDHRIMMLVEDDEMDIREIGITLTTQQVRELYYYVKFKEAEYRFKTIGRS